MAKIALLIGVNVYEPEYGLNPLLTPIMNIRELGRVLEDPDIGGYQVTLLENPTAQTMRDKIEELFSGCSKDDLALLFFSGHGIRDDNDELYFAVCDTQLNEDRQMIYKGRAVAARELKERMNNSRCKRQVVILDCCFSGAAATPFIMGNDSQNSTVNISAELDVHVPTPQAVSINTSYSHNLGREGRVVLTSSSSQQYSLEKRDSDDSSGLSIYTRFLVEGLKTGIADSNADSDISAFGLHEYAFEKVQKEAPAMTPQFFSSKEGHGILIAQSKPQEPEWIYRRVIENLVKQGKDPNECRSYLEKIREDLSLASTRAIEIEEEVLAPIQTFQRHLQDYVENFRKAVEYEQRYPFSTSTEFLKFCQQRYGLRNEDVQSREQEEILYFCEQRLDELPKEEINVDELIRTLNQKLDSLQSAFNLSQQEIENIEYRFFGKFSNREAKIKIYQERFWEALKQEEKYPLSTEKRERIVQLQRVLGLEDAAATAIQRKAIAMLYRQKLDEALGMLK